MRVPRWQASTMFRLKPPAGPSVFLRIWTSWRRKRAAAWRILSVDNAARYLQQLTGVETMTSLRQSIRQDLDNQLLLAQQLREKMSDLMDRAERFQHLNPFNPFEITVEVGSICEGKTLADVNFWQNTMATVIAISHNGELLISPGPHNRTQAGDIVYFVGDENAPSRVDRFLRGGR